MASCMRQSAALLRCWLPMLLTLLLVLVMGLSATAQPPHRHSHGGHEHIRPEDLNLSPPEAGEGESTPVAIPEQSPVPPEQMDVYGVVVKVEEVGSPPGSEIFTPVHQQEVLQKVTVRLDPGARMHGIRENEVVIDNILGENPFYNIPLHPGARVLLNVEKHPSGDWQFYIANRDRTPALMILGALLLLGVLLIGGSEVTKHVLLATVILIGVHKALFPAVMAGVGAVPWTLAMCFMFTILGSFIYRDPEAKASGLSFTREQSVVILGTMGGLLLLGVIMWIMHLITPLDGYISEGLAVLWYQTPGIDYWGLMMSGTLIGFQGFIFYLSWMLAQNRRDGGTLGFSERFAVVMIRGRRLLGPMISSLGLLFLGLYLPTLLQMQGTPTARFVNLESTVSILVVAMAGGLTLVLSVPMVALIAAWMLSPPEGSAESAAPAGEIKQ